MILEEFGVSSEIQGNTALALQRREVACDALLPLLTC